MRRFPLYRQLNQMDCGPACLQMIAKYYGRHYTLNTLRQRSFITREGVSMLGVSDAAESIGMRTIGISTSIEKLCENAPLPCILHWNKNHFVVLYRISKNWQGKRKFHIADPASQHLTYNEEQFINCWVSTYGANGERVGTALLTEPTPDFMLMEGENEPSTKRSLLFFARYLLPYRNQILQLTAGLGITTFLQLVFPFLTQAMVDIGIGGHNISIITAILAVQLLLFVAQLGIGFIRSWLLLYINSRVDIALISDFLMKLMKLPLHYFDTKMTGDILQRIGDHGRIKSFLMGNSINILFSMFNFFIFAAILGYYNSLILCIFLIGNTFYVLWILSFMKYRRELDIKRFNQSAGEQSKLIQLIQGMQEIKLNNCERQKRWEWEHIQVKLFKINIRGLSLGQIQQVGSVFFSQTTNILISFIAAQAVVNDQMTLGMMMSLTYIIGQVSAPIGDFIGFAQSVQDAKISLERLNEIHEQTDEDSHLEEKVQHVPSNHTINIEHVTFSYSGAERDYALKDVSLYIPAGKITAIVGESGSGKTTLIKLLQGFYNPMHGIIKIGNTPLQNINPHIWREATGSVMQEGFIFSDTIANNIAVGVDHVDTSRLQHAVKIANIEDFILSLPLGYSTKIGMEGNGISAGQRQRILIARAIYKDPNFIFLDEATNSLDTTNERVIMENLYSFYAGKTVLIVAHRLSTVKNANKIIVLQKGKVIEEGTHSELVNKHGAYFNLVKNQLELGEN